MSISHVNGVLHLTAFFGVLFFYYNSLVHAAWEGSLDDKKYHKFVESYKTDPGALIKNQEILKIISSDQLHQTVVSLGLTHFTYLFPVQLKGDEFYRHTGKPLSTLSIMAIKGNKLVPIPFQFDEYDETGLVYIDKITQNKPQGTLGKLDEDDELVFMFRDAGTEKISENTAPEKHVNILSEIKLDTPNHAPRYAYLVEGNCNRSDADYVNMSLEKGEIETTLFKISFNPKNVVKDLEVKPKCGPYYGQNVIDSFYVTMSTGILNENIRFGMNSMDNIQAIPVGVKDGPIRACVLFKGRLRYLGMPTPFKQFINVNFYEQACNVPSRFSLDSLDTVKYLINFIKKPRVEISIDLYNLKGARLTFDNVYDPKHPNQTGVVDNTICEFEKKIQQSRLPGEWVYFDSNQGWNFFFSNRMHIEQGGLFDEYLDGIRIHFIYEDNLSSRRDYERYPGAEPRLGVTVEGIPTQALNLMSTLRKINLSKIKNIGALLYELERVGEKGGFKKFDKTSDRLISRLIKDGRIRTKNDLIELFIHDISKINITGIPRIEVINLLRETMQTEISENILPMNHYNLLHKLIELSEKNKIELQNLRYVAADSTLWLPDTIGPEGPEAFYREVLSPPKASIYSDVKNTRYTTNNN